MNYAYDQVREQQADLAGDVQGPLQKLIHDETLAPQPRAAVEQPVFQTAAARAAIKDIQDLLADPAMRGRQSVQSLRNLRTTLLEKGNDYGTNALADSGQRIYKLAAGKVDDAIMDAAKGTDFEGTFREAGQQNAKLQQLYNTRSSPLYRILNTDDPAKVTDGILNRSSVHEIETLKGEDFDLGPLARQAVEDIKNGGFRVTPSGLGGYPDSFLRSLLGPDATRELYLKADIARRLTTTLLVQGKSSSALRRYFIPSPQPLLKSRALVPCRKQRLISWIVSRRVQTLFRGNHEKWLANTRILKTTTRNRGQALRRTAELIEEAREARQDSLKQ